MHASGAAGEPAAATTAALRVHARLRELLMAGMLEPGQKVSLEVRRDNKTLKFEVTLGVAGG